jgi:tripartite-type tricarboxylate transporter receptor subunit TctC
MEMELPKGTKIVVKNVTGAGGRVGTTQIYRQSLTATLRKG